MFDKLRRELELFREMRALIKQAEVEARLACSHMVEAEHLPAAMAAVPFGLDPARDGCAPTDSSNIHRYQLTNHGLRSALFLTNAYNRLLRTVLAELHGPPTPSKFTRRRPRLRNRPHQPRTVMWRLTRHSR